MKVTRTVTRTVNTQILITLNSGEVVLAGGARGELLRRIPTNKIQLIRVIHQCLQQERSYLQTAKEIADMLVESHDYWWQPEEEAADGR